MKTSDKRRRWVVLIRDASKLRTCAKPCHDCPFKKTDTPWLSLAEALDLVEAVKSGRPTLCHHTTNKPDVTPHVCRADAHFKDRPDRTMYTDLFAFVQSAISKYTTVAARRAAWIANQPKHIRKIYVERQKPTE